MDTVTATQTIGHVTDIRGSAYMPYPDQGPPSAPPELVNKFESLMARTTSSTHAGVSSNSVIPDSVVSGVESHVSSYAKTFQEMSTLGTNGMNVGELTVASMRITAQMGMLSMTSTAYTQALTSTKGAVGSLMKNQ